MKNFALVFILAISFNPLLGQSDPQVLLHLQTSDTLVHKALVNQILNLKKELPLVAVKVVCHGPGIDFLLKSKSGYVDKIHRASHAQVSFIGCEFTMTQRKIKSDELVPYAATVPYGLVEIVKLQQAGWLYIKSGF